MAKILYLTLGDYDSCYDEHYRRIIDSMKGEKTQVDIGYLDLEKETEYAFLPPDWTFFNELFKKAINAEKNSYDAIIIGCSADPGLAEVRKIVQIPIIGPLTANLHLANLMNLSVAVIIPGAPWRKRNYKWHRHVIRSAGLQHVVGGFKVLNVNRPGVEEEKELVKKGREEASRHIFEVMGEPLRDGTADALIEECEREGFDGVYFCCTLWSGMLDKVAEKSNLLVFDAVKGSIKVAEALCGGYFS